MEKPGGGGGVLLGVCAWTIDPTADVIADKADLLRVVHLRDVQKVPSPSVYSFDMGPLACQVSG